MVSIEKLSTEDVKSMFILSCYAAARDIPEAFNFHFLRNVNNLYA